MENPAHVPEKLLKAYNSNEHEKEIYDIWEKSGFFNPEKCIEAGYTKPDAKPYTIMMPPPNATGVLHMGHALGLTIQDIAIRFKRMRGHRTLWLPGTDHAAIATQSKVEKEIYKKEGKSRHDLGREELLRRIDAFVSESRRTIASQTRVMGASCDWSREAFTLDATRNRAVNTMFKRMYDDGLIYRGNRIVNWDPKGQTTIADDEIVYEERKAKLYTFKYSKDFPISISTTRPETKVGDTAVAVHPEDSRYQEFVGKEYDAVFCGVPIHIKIIADESVEKDFGTGALGVTPAHSMTDWEIADRHNLPRPQVINEYAKMIVGDERILGKKTTEAREAIVSWLREEGLLEKEEEVNQNVSTAERTGGIVEPLPKLQWFVAVNKEIPGRGKTLKDLMRESVASSAIRIIPEYFEKTYFHWIDNLRDWCISRQIWYGHRVPVWYDTENKPHLQKSRNIIFVRHGESTANQSDIYAGLGDYPLTEKGKEQARKAAELLVGRKIGKIFSSDLPRAVETAEIIEKTIGTPFEISPLFREVGAGNLEGKARNEIPLLVATLTTGTGETKEELLARAKQAWELIYSDQSDGDIVVIGHQSFSSVMKAVLDGETDLIAFRNKWRMGNATTYEFTVTINPPEDNFTQDPDTLDTWFSSGSWTFSTLGWPDKTKDLEIYHPTDMLQCGPDILFFWVARMILMTGYALETIPFHTVYLSGIVRTEKGEKMSKSLGNAAMDPLDIANEFGADAGRMALIFGVAPGTDIKISRDKIKGYKNFCNKLWNITRFVLTYTDGVDMAVAYSDADAAIATEWNTLKQEITNEYETYKFHLVSEKLYQFAWHRFADEVLEESKKILAEGTDAEKMSRKKLLRTVLKELTTMLHPLMPFVTEAIWETLPESNGRLLMVSPWPIHE